MTGRSPRRGMMKSPRMSSGMRRTTVPIAERIAVAQSGNTLWTMILVMAQFRPQDRTTAANRSSAARRERGWSIGIVLVVGLDKHRFNWPIEKVHFYQTDEAS